MAKGKKLPYTNICYPCTADSNYQCDRRQIAGDNCTQCYNKQVAGKKASCEMTTKTIPAYEADVAVNRQRVALQNTQVMAQPQQPQLPVNPLQQQMVHPAPVNLPQQQRVNPAPGYTMIFNMPTTAAPTPQEMQFATQGAPTPPGMAQFQSNKAAQGTPRVPTPAGAPQGSPQVLAPGKNHTRNVNKKANKRAVDPTTGQPRTQQTQDGNLQHNQRGYDQYNQSDTEDYDLPARRNESDDTTDASRQADRDRFAALERRVAEAKARAIRAENLLHAPRTGFPEAAPSLTTQMDLGDDPIIHPGTSTYGDMESIPLPAGVARPMPARTQGDETSGMESMPLPPGTAAPKRKSRS